MNKTILKAQLWELWRLTRVELPVRFLIPIALIYVLGTLVGGRYQLLNGVAFVSILLASLISRLWLSSFFRFDGGGFSLTLGYPRPLSSIQLVSVPLLWFSGCSLLVYFALAATFVQIFGVRPVGASELPLVFLASICIAMVSWATQRLGERVLAVVLLGVVLGLWFNGREAALTYPGWDVGEIVTKGEGLIMVIAAALMWLAAIYFVHLQRSGELGRSFAADKLQGIGEQVLVERKTRFLGPLHASIWFDVRRAGGRALYVLAGGLALMVGSAVFIAATDNMSMFNLFWAASLCLTPLALLVISSESVMGLRYLGHTSSLSVFEATQPDTVGRSILLKTGIATGGTWMGCIVIATAALGCTGLFAGDTWDAAYDDLLDVMKAPVDVAVIWIGGLLTGMVAFAVLCATAALLIMSFGYLTPRAEKHVFAGGAILAGLIIPIVVPALGAYFSWELLWVGKLGALAWGIILVGVALLSLMRCARDGHYSAAFLVACVLAWAALLAALWGFAINTSIDLPQTNLYGYVLFAGLLCVPPASLAWASLSLAALRSQ